MRNLILVVLMAIVPQSSFGQDTEVLSLLETLLTKVEAINVRVANLEATPAVSSSVVADQISELQNGLVRVEAQQASFGDLKRRIEALEGSPASSPVFTQVSPPLLYSSPIIETVIPRVIQTVAPAVVKQVIRQRVSGGRTGPVRRFFRCLLKRRIVTKLTPSSNGHWTFPGSSIADHLMSSPHFLDPSYVFSLSNEQQLSLHDSLHGG